MAPYTVSTVSVDGLDIFYREGGPKDAPVILLLHGFPSSSHQYRNLIPLLSIKYRVIAPDLPGYGFTEVPAERNYSYTFANLATSISALLDALKITKFSVYIFDYGAPVGLRIALQRPHAVQAIITQNGNAYDEGLGEFWAPIRAYWASGAPAERQVLLDNLLTLGATKWQYTTGTPASVALFPEAWELDYTLMCRPGNKDIQLDLFYDYRTNLGFYPDFQKWFRESKVPVLAMWGKNDAIFVPPGAEGFKADVADAEVHLLDAGHFALESHLEEMAGLMLDFLGRKGI